MDEYAEELIELYEGHALALEYASAYIVQTGRSYEEYISILKENGSIKMLNKKRFGAGQTYKGTIIEAYNATLQRIRKEAENDLAMARVEPSLKFIAALLDGNIYVPFIERIHETLKAPLDEAFKDALETDETVFALTKYSLMTRNGNQLYMHRLLREIILDGMEDNGYEAIRDYAKNYYDVFIPMDKERQAIIDKYYWQKRISALFKLDFITRPSIGDQELQDLVLGYTMAANLYRAKSHIVWNEVNKEMGRVEKEKRYSFLRNSGEELTKYALIRCMSLCSDIAMKPDKTRERIYLEIAELTVRIDDIGCAIIQDERKKYIENGNHDIEHFREYLHQLYQDENWMTPKDYHTLAWVFKREFGFDEELIETTQDYYEWRRVNRNMSIEEFQNSDFYKHNSEILRKARKQLIPEIVIHFVHYLYWRRDEYAESEEEFIETLQRNGRHYYEVQAEVIQQRIRLSLKGYRDTFNCKDIAFERIIQSPLFS